MACTNVDFGAGGVYFGNVTIVINTVAYGWEIRQDYSTRTGWGSGARKRRFRKRLLVLVLLLAISGAGGWLALRNLPTAGTVDTTTAAVTIALPGTQGPADTTTGSTTTLPLPQPRYPLEPVISRPTTAGTEAAAEVPVAKGSWHDLTVQAGDNMSLMFSRMGLSANQLHALLQTGAEADALKRLRPGQKIRVLVDGRDLLELVFEQDLFTSLRFLQQDGGYRVEREVVEPERQVTSSVGQIDSSLFMAGQGAGMSDALIMQLVEIFGWDIDFVLDVRRGDRFSVIYEEFSRDGMKVRDGAILAAEFVNRDRTLRAVRYTNTDGSAGYYSDEGAAMKKAFLRTPVNFSRISSRFNLRRKHPVLNRIRAHRGVDYAAPHGTPIKATGDGTIKFAGSRGGYGNVVELQHGGVYSTLYAHMSRFARGIRTGQRVRQGQTIGYVGKSGLATGPHLHYEFRVNGVHRDPLTVPLPKAEPLPPQHMPDFREKVAPLLARLDQLSRQPPMGDSVALNP